jgi:chromosomal replication initiator protein
VSSDRSPNDLKILEDRLRTRFNWGLPVNIYPPDFELKVAILKRIIKAEAITQEIPENVIEYIAANAGTDIRSLIGTLNRLLAYSMTMGKDIDLELALDALKEYLNSGYSEKNDISKVQKIVADYFKISIEDLKSKKRSANIAFPRQIAMYLCRKHTEESLEKIGMEFGGKDHSTVIYAYDRIKTNILKDKNLAEAIEKLEKDLLT